MALQMKIVSAYFGMSKSPDTTIPLKYLTESQ